MIDASAAVKACLSADGFRLLGNEMLVAPRLLWSEATSALHELRWRGTISRELAEAAFTRLESAPIVLRNPRSISREAWNVADQLGWAKTYDAEYVALARLFACRLLTVDERLQRGAARIVHVIGPSDLGRNS